MKAEMPTLGRSPRGPQAQRAIVLLLVAGGAVAVLAWHRSHRAKATAVPPVKTAPAVATRVAPPPKLATLAPPVGAVAPAHAAPPAAPSGAELLARAGVRKVSVTIDGPLETALVAQVGREIGLPLAQVLVRALVWWVEVPNDLRRGDTIDLLLDTHPGDEMAIEAVRFKSGKLGRTFRAYRFKPPADTWSRLYEPDGNELETHLVDAPIDDYEQVTSLLRDGRGHKGVDFKTPVGTPVKATFDGVVERKNWNWHGNGNSIEVAESGGARWHAIYLHLSEVAPELKAGEHVTRGELLGKSGNTGHSFAPHLHYQLMSAGGEVLDPFAAQKTTRRALAPEQRPSFEAEVKRLDALLDLQTETAAK